MSRQNWGNITYSHPTQLECYKSRNRIAHWVPPCTTVTQGRGSLQLCLCLIRITSGGQRPGTASECSALLQTGKTFDTREGKKEEESHANLLVSVLADERPTISRQICPTTSLMRDERCTPPSAHSTAQLDLLLSSSPIRRHLLCTPAALCTSSHTQSV